MLLLMLSLLLLLESDPLSPWIEADDDEVINVFPAPTTGAIDKDVPEDELLEGLTTFSACLAIVGASGCADIKSQQLSYSK
mmetsp:Transcript_390/g.461  ORF Transcript_390/g.461 Transcript_390/m.461 type:complete len:81 (-) Transcript_390:705-947(-)